MCGAMGSTTQCQGYSSMRNCTYKSLYLKAADKWRGTEPSAAALDALEAKGWHSDMCVSKRMNE